MEISKEDVGKWVVWADNSHSGCYEILRVNKKSITNTYGHRIDNFDIAFIGTMLECCAVSDKMRQSTGSIRANYLMELRSKIYGK